jgi:hypothetical protein
MRDAFFLGSGASLPIAPSTRDLTEIALNQVGAYQLEMDARWRRAGSGALATERSAERRDRVQLVIAALKTHIDAFYACRPNPAGCLARETNYEDIGFLADALAGTMSGERDDPAHGPMVDWVANETGIGRSELLEAAEDTVDFLRDVVHMALTGLVPKPGHLRTMVNAIEEAEERLPIYTLNHDCLVERVCDEHRLHYDDFLRISGDRRILEPLSEPQPDAKAAIYKLHGSVNWHRFRRLDGAGGWFASWVGDEISTSGVPHHQGTTWRSDERPLFLLGRFNKELGYLNEPFLDVLNAFTQSLRSRDRLFVSGYSFGDKAVNAMLIEWVFSAPDKRLVVLHRDEQELVNGARGAIRNHWSAWQTAGVLKVVPKFLSDCSWSELNTIM